MRAIGPAATDLGSCHEAREVRFPSLQECPEPGVVTGRDRGANRRPCRQRPAPGNDLWLAGKDAEIADAVEDIEITEDRTENRVHQRELAAVEIGRRPETAFEAGESVGQRC